MTQPNFNQFAGQLVKEVVGNGLPPLGLEYGNPTDLSNFDKIKNLLPKISKTIIYDTRISGDMFAGIPKRVDVPYGVGIEMATFLDGVPNKQLDGKCIPFGTQDLATQLAFINFAYNYEVSIYDRDINKGVMDEGTVASYISNKLALPAKTMANQRNLIWKTLLSDVIDGTRTEVSFVNSDGTGTGSTYNGDVSGYAGTIKDTGIVLPPTPFGAETVFATDTDALNLAKSIQATVRDMYRESTNFNKLGVMTHITGPPKLFMESKTLDGMDNAFEMNAGYKGFPTVDARGYISRFASIVEIDAFEDIPTNASYVNKRLAAVLADSTDFMIEGIAFADVEASRCNKGRYTGYDYQGESMMCVWKGAPSCAFLTNTGGS